MLPIIFPCWERYLLLNCGPQWEAGTYPLLEQNDMTVEVFWLPSAETPEALLPSTWCLFHPWLRYASDKSHFFEEEEIKIACFWCGD